MTPIAAADAFAWRFSRVAMARALWVALSPAPRSAVRKPSQPKLALRRVSHSLPHSQDSSEWLGPTQTFPDPPLCGAAQLFTQQRQNEAVAGAKFHLCRRDGQHSLGTISDMRWLNVVKARAAAVGLLPASLDAHARPW